MLILERFAYGPNATLGRLFLQGGTTPLWTVERPWKDNQRRVSCVPEGEYELVPHDGERFKNTWALVNRDLGVTHFEEAGTRRSAILFHAANTAHELAGCIAPGLTLMESLWGVGSSRAGMRRLRAVLQSEPAPRLSITRTRAGIVQ